MATFCHFCPFFKECINFGPVQIWGWQDGGNSKRLIKMRMMMILLDYL